MVENTVTKELMDVLAGQSGERCHALFFSTQSDAEHPGSLADKFAGGDLDGDMFTVIYDANLVGNVQNRPPWRAPPSSATVKDASSAISPNKISSGLADHFMHARHTRASLVGSCALQLLAIGDFFGLQHKDAIELGGAYYLALDSEINQEPRLSLSKAQKTRWPEWMRERTSRHDVRFEKTESLLSAMYDAELKPAAESA